MVRRCVSPLLLGSAIGLVGAAVGAAPVVAGDGGAEHRHTGMCDASAAVAVGTDRFVVANDEDNVLRVYRATESGGAVAMADLNEFLGLKAGEEDSEADIEGATRIGERIYWITSHGRSKKGNHRPARYRLFATRLEGGGGEVEVVPAGSAYVELVHRLVESENPQIKGLGLDAATRIHPTLEKKVKKLAPKKEGLNVEGLCAAADGKALLIGLRNPLHEGRAILIPLLNPTEVVGGGNPEFGDPMLLPLDGLGIRSIEYSHARGKYLIVGGTRDDDPPDFKLFTWTGKPDAKPQVVEDAVPSGLSPEAVVLYAESDRVQLLSDDGAILVEADDGTKAECKDLEPIRQSFRSLWLDVK